VDLRTNSDYFPIHHEPVGLYNTDIVCLLCGKSAAAAAAAVAAASI
jgi:hypothetical protein